MKNWVTNGEAARYAKVAGRTVRTWCERGYIHSYKMGGRWLISSKSLKSFVEKKKQKDM